ncbi:FliH/SctL family protein [Herbaspirillum huttiense F1]|uniref:FliH/SctL family protein n=1 Tax=Herbaspirillum huttiense subsp. lycopersici TaxID=3074428 RepID=A0ABU2ET09_9BURK|nr:MULTISPECIES: FliH/SctL family protein [Herbaspirillum]MBP1313315.1 flagellar biosynthesis/type III secretory pathway protein FliH [Herbaspirillum sp. 1130]MDR6738557.1 flagellar biosynthesis/type III secretory pathway protein FliH [Herbaspirillum sp. 1173]MDR9851309.1 FliH/SctL family protein [Herbaspirillum huttiense SE1]MDT0358222.1 FliH/SctL family protein [Herbaspirillum huttiense F1]
MSDFAVQRVTVPDQLRAHHGVLRLTGLTVTSDAAQLAEQMLAQARDEAELIREQAAEDARHAVKRQQEEVAQRGTALLEGLQRAQHDMLERIEEVVVDLAQDVMECLLLELAPRDRIAAMLRRVSQEAPAKLHEAVLWVHPDDQQLLPASPWEIQTDSALAPGSCRLEAASGEWRSDFALAVQALRDGLAAARTHLGAQDPS